MIEKLCCLLDEQLSNARYGRFEGHAFVKKLESKYHQPPPDAKNLFIGRTNEIHFFIEGILKPEDPISTFSLFGDKGALGNRRC